MTHSVVYNTTVSLTFSSAEKSTTSTKQPELIVLSTSRALTSPVVAACLPFISHCYKPERFNYTDSACGDFFLSTTEARCIFSYVIGRGRAPLPPSSFGNKTPGNCLLGLTDVNCVRNTSEIWQISDEHTGWQSSGFYVDNSARDSTTT